MDRELKIVVSTALIFFIYGISSYFQNGNFLTLFFLEKIAVVIVSVLFLVLNFKKQLLPGLALLIVASICLTLSDESSVQFLSQKLGSKFIYELSFNETFIIVSIGIFLLQCITGIFLFYKSRQKHWKTFIISFSFLLMLALFFTENPFDQSIASVLFFGSVFILARKSHIAEDETGKYKLLELYSYQFLLLTLLNLMDIFSRFSYISKSFS